MIIEYENKYANNVQELLLELQQYIESIDILGYNRVVDKDLYKEEILKKTLKEVEENDGKIYLYQEENQIVGLIIGIINNEATEENDFKVPKRGRITELIVSSKVRSKGLGKKLMTAIEEYLKSKGCEDILIEVFGYNDNAFNFYKKNGYHTRMYEVIKKLDK
jgi:ribosomal protein S18 acetylase RimI-like enzyme